MLEYEVRGPDGLREVILAHSPKLAKEEVANRRCVGMSENEKLGFLERLSARRKRN